MADEPVTPINGVDIKKIGIMAVGKTGIGKSTLLNCLLGTEEFEAHGPGSGAENPMSAGTVKVTIVKKTINGVEVTFYDTPGLETDMDESTWIEAIAEVIKDVDLILFCIDGTSTRWSECRREILTFHSRFKNEFLQYCLVVLTRSNLTQSSILTKRSLSQNQKTEKCLSQVKDFEKQFRSELKSLGVPSEIINRVPIIAAGDESNRTLSCVTPELQNADFLPELWSQALKMSKESARLSFYLVSNYNQTRFVTELDNSDKIQQEAYAQLVQLQTSECVSQNEQAQSQCSPIIGPEPNAQIGQLQTSECVSQNEQAQSQCSPTNEPESLAESPPETGPQPAPIVLSKKQSCRMYKALAKAGVELFTVVGISSGTGIGVGATVWAATALTMAVAGPVGICVGLGAGIVGITVLAGVWAYRYRKHKKEQEQERQGAVGIQ